MGDKTRTDIDFKSPKESVKSSTKNGGLKPPREETISCSHCFFFNLIKSRVNARALLKGDTKIKRNG